MVGMSSRLHVLHLFLTHGVICTRNLLIPLTHSALKQKGVLIPPGFFFLWAATDQQLPCDRTVGTLRFDKKCCSAVDLDCWPVKMRLFLI